MRLMQKHLNVPAHTLKGQCLILKHQNNPVWIPENLKNKRCFNLFSRWRFKRRVGWDYKYCKGLSEEEAWFCFCSASQTSRKGFSCVIILTLGGDRRMDFKPPLFISVGLTCAEWKEVLRSYTTLPSAGLLSQAGCIFLYWNWVVVCTVSRSDQSPFST